MTTTAQNITDEQIEKLRTEACLARDYAQAAICDIALGDEPGDWSGPSRLIDGRRIRDMTDIGAREECERVINEAKR